MAAGGKTCPAKPQLNGPENRTILRARQIRHWKAAPLTSCFAEGRVTHMGDAVLKKRPDIEMLVGKMREKWYDSMIKYTITGRILGTRCTY